jgi:1-aminocyclopropane-1-carboxylate deaminase
MLSIQQKLDLPSPIHIITHPILDEFGVNLSIKRDDLIHPKISGNKWRKLNLNLQYTKAKNLNTIITYGGAYSNHLYATAAACQMLGIRSIGIIRGEIDYANPTLSFCVANGMTLWSVSRSEYRQKEESPVIQEIISRYQNSYVIPEGGSNEYGMMGVAEIHKEIVQQLSIQPDYIICACGSGGTTAGLAIGASPKTKILSIPVLKTDHLTHEVKVLIGDRQHSEIEYVLDYHHGGYAKYSNQLVDQILRLRQEINIPLDQVYNGKALLGLFDMISKHKFEPGSNLLYLHTGGMQGALDVLR